MEKNKMGMFYFVFFFSYMFHSSYAYTLGKEKRWWYYVCPFFVPFTYCYYILLTTWRARRIGRCTETLFSFSSYFIFIVVYFYDAYSSSQSLAFNAPLFELARKGHLHFPGPVCRLHFFLSREKNPNLHIEKIKKSKINKKNLLFIYSRTFIHLKITVGFCLFFFLIIILFFYPIDLDLMDFFCCCFFFSEINSRQKEEIISRKRWHCRPVFSSPMQHPNIIIISPLEREKDLKLCVNLCYVCVHTRIYGINIYF